MYIHSYTLNLTRLLVKYKCKYLLNGRYKKFGERTTSEKSNIKITCVDLTEQEIFCK